MATSTRSAKSRGANAGAGGGSAVAGDGPDALAGARVKQEPSQRQRATPRRSPRLQRKQAMGLLGTPGGGGSGRGGPGSTPEQWTHGLDEEAMFIHETGFADSPSKLSSFLSPLKQTPRHNLGTPSASPSMAQFYQTLSPISAWKGMGGRAGELGKSPLLRCVPAGTLPNPSPFHPSPMPNLQNMGAELGSPSIPLPSVPRLARRLTFPANHGDEAAKWQKLDFSSGVKRGGLLKYEIKGGVLQNLTPGRLGYGSPGQVRKAPSIARNLNLGGNITRIGGSRSKKGARAHPSLPMGPSQDEIDAQLRAAPAFSTPKTASKSRAKAAPPPVRGGAVKQTPGLPIKRRTPCNCKKSKCLKLYCECFAAGRVCSPECHCAGCNNSHDHDTVRQAAITQTLERNPNAFKPKIQHGREHAQHTKGCHCKKSGCQKKYCECFQAGIACGDNCKCLSCKNQPADHQRRLKEAAAKAATKSNKRGNSHLRTSRAAAPAPAPAPPPVQPAVSPQPTSSPPSSSLAMTPGGHMGAMTLRTPGRAGFPGSYVRSSPGEEFYDISTPSRKRYRVSQSRFSPARPIQVSMTMDMAGLSPITAPQLAYVTFGTHCTHMPRDVAVRILSFLSSHDLYHVSLTCKIWNDTAMDDSLWDYIYM